jgi:hypothetical protein
VEPTKVFQTLFKSNMEVPADRKLRCKVIYVDLDGNTQDISKLNPSSEDDIEAEWGGLTTMASEAGCLIRRRVNEREYEETNEQD